MPTYCPQCKTEVNINAQICPQCALDLSNLADDMPTIVVASSSFAETDYALTEVLSDAGDDDEGAVLLDRKRKAQPAGAELESGRWQSPFLFQRDQRPAPLFYSR